MQTTYFDKGYFEMQPNYEYLEMPAGAAFELQLVVELIASTRYEWLKVIRKLIIEYAR